MATIYELKDNWTPDAHPIWRGFARPTQAEIDAALTDAFRERARIKLAWLFIDGRSTRACVAHDDYDGAGE